MAVLTHSVMHVHQIAYVEFTIVLKMTDSHCGGTPIILSYRYQTDFRPNSEEYNINTNLINV